MAKTLILNQADLRDCVGLDADSLEGWKTPFACLPPQPWPCRRSCVWTYPSITAR